VRALALFDDYDGTMECHCGTLFCRHVIGSTRIAVERCWASAMICSGVPSMPGSRPALAPCFLACNLSWADEQLLRELTERARTGGLQLTGEGGLLGKLTKMVIEGAPEGELDDHLGYGKNDPAGRNGGNSRNGHRAKTVLTDTGPVEITVPRDRESSFEPRIVAKRQRRLTGVDNMVISLSAKG
jgi:hypothetical protein